MRDFGFAFNDTYFSDRVLRLEIIPDDQSLDSDAPNRKRKRTDNEKGDASDSDSESCAGVKFKTLHISSPILAEISPFFYKLFKNGMRESQDTRERPLNLRIVASEEAAMMDLLKFIYNNTLAATTAEDLVNVLMVADKFVVVSCMRYCCKMLQELPMSPESALSYLELPPNVSMAKEVLPLIDAAKKYLVERYRDIYKSKQDLMALPLHVVELILGSDGLQTYTEDGVYNFILKWARAHYPKLEERREILTKRMTQYICFQNMSTSKLKEVLVCSDFEHEQVSMPVLEALFLKVDDPYKQHIHSSRRVYKCLPIKVVPFEHPRPRLVVYWDLKKEDCAALYLTGELLSQPFYVGGKCFGLWVECSQEEETSLHCFDIYVQMYEDSETCMVDMEIAVMEKQSMEYQRRIMLRRFHLGGDDVLKYRKLWTEFMYEGSKYFIDGMLCLRATFTNLH